MTLVVAKVVGDEVWMVADTAITGGDIGLRDRRFMPKVETGINFPSLIGFAGGAEKGLEAATVAARAVSPRSALEILNQASDQKSVQFAYAFFQKGKPHLCRIEDGAVTEERVLHLGSDAAFEVFQRTRHTEGVAPPLSLKSFMAGSTVPISGEFMSDIRAMLDLFPARFDHDVGGWATPFILAEHGAYPCSYCYSTSDPVFDEIVIGSLVGHGTAVGGGYTLSYTNSPECDLMVVYIPQSGGGWVAVRTEKGFDTRRIDGSPEQFKGNVLEQTGRRIETWVGSSEPGPVQRLHVKRNSEGSVDVVIADHGGSYTFAIHNVQTEFTFQSKLLSEEAVLQPPKGVVINQNNSQGIELIVEQSNVFLTAEELDRLLNCLAEARSMMTPEVPLQRAAGTAIAQCDPAWRTLRNLHPAVDGHLLSLRHSGFGWVEFLLPSREAANLGKWLTENSKNKEGS
jgi:hypothetical protein